MNRLAKTKKLKNQKPSEPSVAYLYVASHPCAPLRETFERSSSAAITKV